MQTMPATAVRFTNLTGSVTDIDDSPDASDGNWATRLPLANTLLYPGLGALASTGRAPAATTPVESLFSADFSDTPTTYNFAGMYDEGTQWTATHLSTGSHSGGPACRLTADAGVSQFSMGWYTPATTSWTPTSTSTVYYRMRIRFGAGFPWGSMQRKFLQFGSVSTPQSRCILYLLSPQNNLFGLTDETPSGGLPDVDNRKPSYFGVPYSTWDNAAIVGKYGSLNLHRGIGWTSSGPILLTDAGNSSPYPPGPDGAAPVDGWYHIQFSATASTANDFVFKLWANCNDFDTPQQSSTYYSGAEGTGLGVTDWNQSFGFGVYHDENSSAESIVEVSAVQRGLTFDPSWYP